MSARREFVLRELLPDFEISSLARPIPLGEVLNSDTIMIDFGSGMGAHALNLATSSSDLGVLAIDVHTVGLLAIAETATQHNLTNIRMHHGDGIDVLKSWLTPESIAEIHILFPDPWPKARHHKRRLINREFLELALAVLRPGGRIIFVTDDESYFEPAKLCFLEKERLDVKFDDWEIPKTTYHQRAIRLGHEISQLSAYKI
jgi:tRNA (guanine-N7-)-methyltransferase